MSMARIMRKLGELSALARENRGVMFLPFEEGSGML
jgi:hypothetical protein